MSFLSIILGLVGLGITIVGVLAVAGKLPGNSVVGLRIPEVRKSQENWVMGHKIAGPAWTGSGVAMLGAAVVTWTAAGWTWLVVAGLVVASLFLLGLGAALASHTMAQVDARAQQAAAADSGCCSSGGDATADPNSSASGCCSDESSDGVVSAEACASGQACGSCSLNGSCEGGAAAFDSARAAETPAQNTTQHNTPALDLDAARRAAAAQDSAQ